jgi:TRAP-type C4-dicarboxylate transport system substrate-binding protein
MSTSRRCAAEGGLRRFADRRPGRLGAGRPWRWASVVALAIALGGAAETSARVLKIATPLPEGSGFVAEMRAAGERIEERTEGRVKLKLYPGGVMGNDMTVMRKMRVGQLHGAALPSGPLASVDPNVEIYSLPLFFRDRDEVAYVRARVDPKLEAGLAEKGFTTLSITDGGFAYFFSRSPIRSVEDLPQAKIWIPEGDVMSQTALEIAGASPIPLPTADVYTALQTGLIDTVAAPPMGAIAFQWHTRVRAMTDVPLMYLIGLFVVDNRSFAKLRPGDQAVLREEIEGASRRLDAEARKGEASAIDALRSHGIEFVSPRSDAERERWHEISVEAMDRLRASGRYSNALIDEMIEHVEAYRAATAAAPAVDPAPRDADDPTGAAAPTDDTEPPLADRDAGPP